MGGEWPRARIGDIAEKVAMGPFGSSIKVETFVSQGVPIISGQHLHTFRLDERAGFRFITQEHAERLQNACVYRGDVIFTHAGNIGQVAYIPEAATYDRYVISQRQFYMRCKLKRVIPQYVVYYFSTSEGRHQLLANAAQVGVPSLARPVSYLRDLQIPLPPLNEQRAIACILGALDDKIELNRRMNETLEGIARAIFKSWFVDFDPVRAKAEGRDPGLPAEITDLFPSSFVDSELGPIPEGWEIKHLGDLASVNEWTLGRTDELDIIDYIEISEVLKGDIGKVAQYRRGCEPSRARRRLRHGDTILSTVRPDRGAYCLCIEPPASLIASTGFAVLTPRHGQWAIVHCAATDSRIGHALGRLADGGAYPAVRPEVIAGLRVVVPTWKELMEQYEQVAQLLFLRAAANRRESETLAALRDSLLPKLISGELRVPDAERIVGRCV